jgi:hypothetical protein
MAGTAAGIVTIAGTIIVTGAAGNFHPFQIGPFIAGLFSFRWSLVHDVAVMKEELVMKTLIGAALVAGALVSAGPAAIGSATAAPQAKPQAFIHSDATDFSARRYHQRHYHRYGYRPYDQPYYYARPSYYRPYPYDAPAPFPLGFGFGPSWW